MRAGDQREPAARTWGLRPGPASPAEVHAERLRRTLAGSLRSRAAPPRLVAPHPVVKGATRSFGRACGPPGPRGPLGTTWQPLPGRQVSLPAPAGEQLTGGGAVDKVGTAAPTIRSDQTRGQASRVSPGGKPGNLAAWLAQAGCPGVVRGCLESERGGLPGCLDASLTVDQILGVVLRRPSGRPAALKSGRGRDGHLRKRVSAADGAMRRGSCTRPGSSPGQSRRGLGHWLGTLATAPVSSRQ